MTLEFTVKPTSEDELAYVISEANAPFQLVGGGTRAFGETQGRKMDFTEMSGINLYEPGALTLVARAGTKLSQIEAAVAAEGQCLPFEPPHMAHIMGRTGESTIGGVVAANASGPRRVLVGACRDSLIGIRYVDGTGQIIRNGGRVMKNVTGYDLVKLIAGSHGTMGAITEVAFKLLPAPQTEATLLLHNLPKIDALRAMTRALSTPWEVSGACMLPTNPGGQRSVALRLEGMELQVTARLSKLQTFLKGLGVAEQITDPFASRALWQGIRDLAPMAPEGPPEVLIKVLTRTSQMTALLGAVRCEGLVSMADWGGGLIWLSPPAEMSHQCLAAARQFTLAHGGHATLLKGRSSLPSFPPDADEAARLSAMLRAKFDPRGVLNPGLMS